MTRLAVRLGVGAIAVAATIALAAATLVLEPVRAAAMADARLQAAGAAALAAEAIDRGGAPPPGAVIADPLALPDGGVAAPLADGRHVAVPTPTVEPLVARVRDGLIGLAAVAIAAAGGWALWAGLLGVRQLRVAHAAVLRLVGREPDGHDDDLLAAVERVRAELDDLDRQRAARLGMVAHDLRSPVTGILLALERVARGDARATAAVERECARLTAMADGVVDACRPSPPDGVLGGVLEDVAARVAGVVAIDVEVPTVLAGARCSDVAITRAVANLTENAARHARSAVRVTAAVADDAIEVAVEDDGPGLPSDVPVGAFRQGEGPRGTAGLGLASVQTLMRELGGALRFEPANGGGTRAVLRIPATQGR